MNVSIQDATFQVKIKIIFIKILWFPATMSIYCNTFNHLYYFNKKSVVNDWLKTTCTVFYILIWVEIDARLNFYMLFSFLQSQGGKEI